LRVSSIVRAVEGDRSIASLPASIFEKSRMSLMMVSRDSAEDLTICRYSRCSSSSVGVQRQIRHADDAVHRRADFVAHVGEEVALGPAGGLGRVARQDQALLPSNAVGQVDHGADQAADAAVGAGQAKPPPSSSGTMVAATQ
jgi:hypothetical protein